MSNIAVTNNPKYINLGKNIEATVEAMRLFKYVRQTSEQLATRVLNCSEDAIKLSPEQSEDVIQTHNRLLSLLTQAHSVASEAFQQHASIYEKLEAELQKAFSESQK